MWQKGLLWGAIALFMGLAYATRNVLLVVWIAMVIMQILVLLRSKKWQGLPALCVVLAVMLLGKTTLCHMAEGQLEQGIWFRCSVCSVGCHGNAGESPTP